RRHLCEERVEIRLEPAKTCQRPRIGCWRGHRVLPHGQCLLDRCLPRDSSVLAHWRVPPCWRARCTPDAGAVSTAQSAARGPLRANIATDGGDGSSTDGGRVLAETGPRGLAFACRGRTRARLRRSCGGATARLAQ